MQSTIIEFTLTKLLRLICKTVLMVSFVVSVNNIAGCISITKYDLNASLAELKAKLKNKDTATLAEGKLFLEALKKDPNDAKAQQKLTNWLYNLGLDQYQIGFFKTTVHDYDERAIVSAFVTYYLANENGTNATVSQLIEQIYAGASPAITLLCAVSYSP